MSGYSSIVCLAVGDDGPSSYTGTAIFQVRRPGLRRAKIPGLKAVAGTRRKLSGTCRHLTTGLPLGGNRLNAQELLPTTSVPKKAQLSDGEPPSRGQCRTLHLFNLVCVDEWTNSPGGFEERAGLCGFG